MPRVSAPLVLLPAWLVMVACSPHSLRIGKYSLALGGGVIVTLSVHTQRKRLCTSQALWDASLTSLSGCDRCGGGSGKGAQAGGFHLPILPGSSHVA